MRGSPDLPRAQHVHRTREGRWTCVYEEMPSKCSGYCGMQNSALNCVRTFSLLVSQLTRVAPSPLAPLAAALPQRRDSAQ